MDVLNMANEIYKETWANLEKRFIANPNIVHTVNKQEWSVVVKRYQVYANRAIEKGIDPFEADEFEFPLAIPPHRTKMRDGKIVYDYNFACITIRLDNN